MDKRERRTAAAAVDSERKLRERGLRATVPRVAVLTLLREMGGHRSVDELVALLGERGTRLPRMSVYNVVADLTESGLVMCADTGPGRAVYEASDAWHHHFVCRACGVVMDVPCTRGRKPCIELPASVPASADEAQVIFRGLCHACSGRRGAASHRKTTKKRAT